MKNFEQCFSIQKEENREIRKDGNGWINWFINSIQFNLIRIVLNHRLCLWYYYIFHICIVSRLL